VHGHGHGQKEAWMQWNGGLCKQIDGHGHGQKEAWMKWNGGLCKQIGKSLKGDYRREMMSETLFDHSFS